MSDYPECDRLAEASKQTQPIGEFIDWLQTQGVQLMIWREDLTDSRPTDLECAARKRGWPSFPPAKLPCDPAPDDTIASEYRWTAHCMHWQDPQREADGEAKQGTCCHCHRGHYYEVTGIRSWTHEQRGTEQLLADWAGIDLKKVDAERRQILAAIRSANERPAA